MVKKGTIRNIQLTIEDRQGGRKHVTRVTHVESFGFDADELADIDAELKEFMGSDAESDSDNDSMASGSSISVRLGKRKRPSGESGAEESDADGSSTRDRGGGMGTGTGLRNVANAASERGSTESLTPMMANGDREGEADDVEIARQQRRIEGDEAREAAEEEDSDDELARELERELESDDDGGNEEDGFMGPIGGEDD